MAILGLVEHIKTGKKIDVLLKKVFIPPENR